MNNELPELKVGQISAEKAPLELSNEQKAIIELMVKREAKKAKKQSVWYRNKKISWKEWADLSYEERMSENNIIRK